MVGLGSSDRNSSGGVGVAVPERVTPRNRMKPRLAMKPPSLLPLSSSQRKNLGITDLNRRITDLKVENNSGNSAQNKIQSQTEFQQRLQPTSGTQTQIRRDSSSTVSSYYGSMRSTDMSRKSSLASQVCIFFFNIN